VSKPESGLARHFLGLAAEMVPELQVTQQSNVMPWPLAVAVVVAVDLELAFSLQLAGG
jgi:hypothetical protein